jgi:hypothetical protein
VASNNGRANAAPRCAVYFLSGPTEANAWSRKAAGKTDRRRQQAAPVSVPSLSRICAMPPPIIPTIIGSTTVSVNSVADDGVAAGGKHLRARSRLRRMIADHDAAAARCRLLLTIEYHCRAIAPVTGHSWVNSVAEERRCMPSRIHPELAVST